MAPTPDPVAAATETLRRYLAIAEREGWAESAAAIVAVINVVESRTF